jgi:hypothetical protein
MTWDIILEVSILLFSVAGLFYAGHLLAVLLEKVFHIHLL